MQRLINEWQYGLMFLFIGLMPHAEQIRCLRKIAASQFLKALVLPAGVSTFAEQHFAFHLRQYS